MSVASDVKRYTRKLAKIRTVELGRATSSALNKATKNKIKPRVVKAVSALTNVPQKHVRRKVFIDKSTVKTQKARLVVFRSDVSLVSLLSKGNVETRLQKSKRKRRTKIKWKGEVFEDAFVASPNPIYGKSPKPQVFRRTTRIRKTWPQDKRHKHVLETVKIPIAHVVDKVTLKVANRVMQNEYPKLLKHELEFRLNKYVTR